MKLFSALIFVISALGVNAVAFPSASGKIDVAHIGTGLSIGITGKAAQFLYESLTIPAVKDVGQGMEEAYTKNAALMSCTQSYGQRPTSVLPGKAVYSCSFEMTPEGN